MACRRYRHRTSVTPSPPSPSRFSPFSSTQPSHWFRFGAARRLTNRVEIKSATPKLTRTCLPWPTRHRLLRTCEPKRSMTSSSAAFTLPPQPQPHPQPLTNPLPALNLRRASSRGASSQRASRESRRALSCTRRIGRPRILHLHQPRSQHRSQPRPQTLPRPRPLPQPARQPLPKLAIGPPTMPRPTSQTVSTLKM